jgi:hypothetical protein
MNKVTARKELVAWSQKSGYRGTPECDALIDMVVRDIEALPVQIAGVRRPAGFILVGEQWHAVNVLRETRDGWAEWRWDHPEGGERDSGVSPLGKWARCTADNTPALPEEFYQREVPTGYTPDQRNQP